MKRITVSIIAVLAAATLYAQAPVIGISGHQSKDNNLAGITYTSAVIAAGGAPVVIPVLNDDILIESIVNSIDGLIMTGGEDFDPLKYYGEQPIPELGKVVPERDEFDVKLVRAAVKRGIPVLGICRGEQLLAVAFGGSLWQDIPSQVKGSFLKHRQSPVPSSQGTHNITIEKGSFLERTLKADSALVNSFHHQAIKALPNGFRVVATSTDGIVEAVERVAPLEGYPDGGGMIIGTQFHPEGLVRGEDKSFMAIFGLLVKEAGRK